MSLVALSSLFCSAVCTGTVCHWAAVPVPKRSLRCSTRRPNAVHHANSNTSLNLKQLGSLSSSTASDSLHAFSRHQGRAFGRSLWQRGLMAAVVTAVATWPCAAMAASPHCSWPPCSMVAIPAGHRCAARSCCSTAVVAAQGTARAAAAASAAMASKPCCSWTRSHRAARPADGR